MSLAHYIFEPRLDNPAAVAEFVADKDHEHSRSGRISRRPQDACCRRAPGLRVEPQRPGRLLALRGVVSAAGPQRAGRMRGKQQADRFKRLCDEAIRSLEFH